MTDPGIDYSMGGANRDADTGIHYGAVSIHNVLQQWADESEDYYGEPTCPKCGNEVVPFDSEHEAYTPYREHSMSDFACEECEHALGSDEVYSDERMGAYLDDGEYKASESESLACVIIEKSPYYMRANYCSPCIPGAGDIDSPNDTDGGVKTYCFNEDWYDEGEMPDFHIYCVQHNKLVYCPEGGEGCMDWHHNRCDEGCRQKTFNDPEHKEMREWGYKWNATKGTWV